MLKQLGTPTLASLPFLPSQPRQPQLVMHPHQRVRLRSLLVIGQAVDVDPLVGVHLLKRSDCGLVQTNPRWKPTIPSSPPTSGSNVGTTMSSLSSLFRRRPGPRSRGLGGTEHVAGLPLGPGRLRHLGRLHQRRVEGTRSGGGAALRGACRSCALESRPLVYCCPGSPGTSIVTHKDGDKEPGPGFYDMARKLGYRFDEPFVFWGSQVQEVFKVHGRPKRRARD